MATDFETDVAVVGGCGHVGLPLGLAFASRGLDVVLQDIDAGAVEKVRGGALPWHEDGAQPVLDATLGRRLSVTEDPEAIATARSVVIVVGTPVGSHMNPRPEVVPHLIRTLAPHLRDGQLVVLRSTIYPGVSAEAERTLDRLGLDIDLAVCPERIAEGRAMTELFSLPQIVAGTTPRATAAAKELFAHLTDQLVALEPAEAELAKLFTNVWRYIKFAAGNQLYMIANDLGLDYDRIRAAAAFDYPRAADMAPAGFAAGPCLLKDTVQLAEFDDRNFTLGHASVAVNESFPIYLASRIARRWDLPTTTVGVLGMAFKGDSDDARSSLSYKLKRALTFRGAEVLCHDPFVRTDADLVPIDTVLERADVLVVAAPHDTYRTLVTDLPVVDVWNLRGEGVVV